MTIRDVVVGWCLWRSKKLVQRVAIVAGLSLLVGCAPSLKSSSADERKKALERVTDQAVLAQCAREDLERDVRLAAIERMTDQSLLGQVAVAETEEPVALAALARITDQRVLLGIASDKTPTVSAGRLGHDAVMKLTDEASLARIVLEGSEAELRELAVSKLSDPGLLAKIALESTDGHFVQLAIAKINDQTVLAKIAGDMNSPARSEAVDRLTDQALLRNYALHDTEVSVRSAATARLTDQALLGSLALEDKEVDVRQAAVGKLADAASLIKVSLNDHEEESEVRCLAMDALAKLGDKAAAERLSSALTDWRVSGTVGITLEKLGWQPATAAERVHLWASKQDVAKMRANWDETKRVLSSDLRSVDLPEGENAVYTLVNLGKPEVTPELIQYLNQSSNPTLAETLLNCGNPELHEAALDWAKRKGYETIPTSVGVNPNAAWGSWHSP